MERKKQAQIRRLIYYYIYLLIVWGGFRYVVDLPEVIEELWFKPVIWLLPWFWWRLSLKGEPKLFEGNWLKSVGWGVLMGGIYWGLVSYAVKGEIGRWSIDTASVALITAVVEELTFSGLVLGFLDRVNKSRRNLNLGWLGLMVVGIHLPINIWDYKLGRMELLAVCWWLWGMAVVNGWLRRRTNNVTAAVVARWGLLLGVLL